MTKCFVNNNMDDDNPTYTKCFICFNNGYNKLGLTSVRSLLEGTTQTIKEIISTCTSTKEVSLKAKVCAKCLNLLKFYYSFYEQCHQSDKIRESSINDTIETRLSVIKIDDVKQEDIFEDVVKISDQKRSKTKTDKNFICTYCNHSFTTKYYRDKHENSRTNEEVSVNSRVKKLAKKFKCKYCDHMFAYKSCKEKHEKSHKDKNRLNEKSLKRKKKEERKISLEESPEEKFCMEDNYINSDNDSLAVGADVAIEDADKVKEDTDKVIEDDDDKKIEVAHKEIEHSDKEIDDADKEDDDDDDDEKDGNSMESLSYKCEYCDDMFDQNSKYYQHLRKQHNKYQRTKATDTKNAYLCNVCGKTFNDRSTLRVHIRIHTGEKPYKCKYCPKSFVSFGSLSPHLRTHTGERRYACSYCDARFIHAANRNQHLKIHTGNRPHVCDVCEKGYYRADELRDHMRKHTGEKPFQCNICNKKLRNKRVLKQHLLGHEERCKTHVCNVCGKGFTHSYNLKRHLPSHPELQIITPHMCNVCGKSFWLPYLLKRHLKTHENQKKKMLKKMIANDDNIL